jgi:hypothetical protein
MAVLHISTCRLIIQQQRPVLPLTGGSPGLGRGPHAGIGYNKNINVRLDNEELWVKFNEIGTEMIITKTGR